ncbi:hypothetical protein CA13_47450 [Planctomycetes bacterium CA13]|uniref:Uncharacterized protein n=1 Tax=Novipirellula herctigrandis TaxID=2527986 RepID=A0A5C5Z7V6_9BACT|nr:hypothetical protein CA13_47450 [Planctomycetes bacterium CA13]
MLSVFIGIFVVWVVVTVLGHASWVIVANLYRAIFGLSDPRDRTFNQDPFVLDRNRSDRLAACRVADRLLGAELIDPTEHQSLREKLAELNSVETERLSINTPNQGLAPEGVRSLDWSVPLNTTASDIENDTEPPIVAELVHEPSALHAGTASSFRPIEVEPSVAAQEKIPTTEVSAISKAEIIRSFLATHNIRWGELVAGMLIVVCSIGLVISLWNTLMATHRVVPSLILLAGNAAIFAAGLYTLSRWKLRHTSRAVLVIATVLVPLSILAGLAAVGRPTESVQLDDPITLVALFGGAVVYLVLLRLGAKALVGRPGATAMVLSVAGPSVVLPIVPAAWRVFDSSAGWVVAVGAFSIIAAMGFALFKRTSKNRLMGATAGRNLLLMMFVGLFALAVSVGYAIFMVGSGADSLMRIAIAVVPALVGLAAAGQVLTMQASRSIHAMIGMVITVLTMAACWTILPAAIQTWNWTWVWAGVLSVSTLTVAWILRKPQWLAASTMPVGIAFVLSSTVWMRDVAWASLPFWVRLISGEAMIAAILFAAILFGLSWIVRQSDQQRWLGNASLLWGGVSFGIAACLAIGPAWLLGSASAWAVTVVLAAGSIVVSALASRYRAFAYIAIALVGLSWDSVLKPIALFTPSILADSRTWMQYGLALSGTLLLLREGMWFGTKAETRRYTCQSQSMSTWISASVVCSGATSILACFVAAFDWSVSATALAVASALMLWAATTNRSSLVLGLSQFASVAVAIVIGYEIYQAELFSIPSWASGAAPWYWGILWAVVAMVWFFIREFASISITRPRLGFIAKDQGSPRQMVDGAAVLFSITNVVIGVAVAFGMSLLAVASGDAFSMGIHVSVPLLSLVMVGIAAAWWGHLDEHRWPSMNNHQSIVLFAAIVVWCAIQFAEMLTLDPILRLIAATTFAAVVVQLANVSLNKTSPKIEFLAKPLPLAITAGLVGISSLVMLWFHWAGPIVDGWKATPIPTAAVVVWWLVASACLYMASQKTNQSSLAIGSAILAPAAVAIAVPAFSLVHPVVWIQVAALASLVWMVIACTLSMRTRFENDERALSGSFAFLLVVGIASALAKIVEILLDVDSLAIASGPVALLVSTIAIGMWAVLGWPSFGETQGLTKRLSWPMAFSLIAGQLAWGLETTDILPSSLAFHFVAVVWLVSCIASAVEYQSRNTTVALFHAIAMSVIVCFMAMLHDSNASVEMEWIGLVACVVAGAIVVIIGRKPLVSIVCNHSQRILSWFTVFAGGYLFTQLGDGYSLSAEAVWTAFVLWLASWVIAWRAFCVCRKMNATMNVGSLADRELSSLLVLFIVGELVWVAIFGDRSSLPFRQDSFLWARLAGYALVAVSTFLRGDQRLIWQGAFTMLIGVAAIVVTGFSELFDLGIVQRHMVLMVATGFALMMVVFSLRPLFKTIVALSRSVNVASPVRLARLARSVEQVAFVVAVLGGVVSIGMIFGRVDPATIRVTIITVAMAAIAYFELSELTSQNRLRYFAVMIGLFSVSLWASVVDGGQAYPWLVGSMQWLVGGLFATVTLLFVVPRLLGHTTIARWQPAMRSGAIVSGAATCVSLFAMLAIEAVVRDADGIGEISRTLVIGVGVILVLLSLLSALVAILTGPGFSLRETLLLSDRQRQVLVVVSQAIAAIAWLHLFLCKTHLAFLGLRAYWPYIVMLISFAGVGATEWAKRRKDKVLSATLAPTALYLPLIPAIGFWLSSFAVGGEASQWSWMFIGGKVPYALLLAIGSAYYIGLSLMWKHAFPRITAIVLGNAALWVVLVQMPGWSFLAHPQAWLIPPAVCILVVAHFYRDRLQPNLATAIRYGMTLVIYVSSTADMLLQQIGSSISGPIVLVILALAGMLAGVVLRVRPFLYLGASFVFIGVASMVRHAQVSIDAVWPWWAFGITTGVLLLAGLMWIEKNKPRLRQYANTLSSWDA